jgi:hypothetical protein
MFAVGCIQAQQCHTGRCPTGVATQDPERQRALVPVDKAPRVAHYHQNTLHALAELLQAAGLQHPKDLTTTHIACRIVDNHVSLLSSQYPSITPGSLLAGDLQSPIFQIAWPMATAESFAPLATLDTVIAH